MLRLFKFSLVGGIGAVSLLGLMFLFTDILGLYYMISAVISGIIITSYNYFVNNYWTFGDRSNGGTVIGGSKFLAVSILYHGFYYPSLYLFTSVLNIHYLISVIIVTIIGFLLKYFLCYVWVWRKECEY